MNIPSAGRRARPFAVLLLACCTLPAWAEKPPLPSPLTLDFVLGAPVDEHYEVQARQAELDGARAAQQGVEARDGLTASLHGHLRWIDPANLAADQRNNDNGVYLIARKRLYDFGRFEAQLDASRVEVGGREWVVLDARQQRRLGLMRDYFDVLLSDLDFSVFNEGMAIAYVTLDKARDRAELGQVNRVELLREESQYQDVLRERNRAQNAQRITRARLAEGMARPGELSAELTEPKLDAIFAREPGDYQVLVREVLDANPTRKAMLARVEAAGLRVRAAQAKQMPEIYTEVEAGRFVREVGSRDPFRAGLYINVPLLTGGAVDAERAKTEAERLNAQSDLARIDAALRQRTLELWQEIQLLRGTAMEGDRLRAEYRDLYFTRSQALYEMEVSADLGDSMVRLSEARLAQARTLYRLALAWAELDMLRGKDLSEFARVAAVNEKKPDTTAEETKTP